MLVFYHICGDNLGFAIIFIAVITRFVMIPLMRRQTEMTRKMAGLKPQLDELQKQYKNNPKKLSEEQTKLYKKVGYNPLGCLVTFIPQLVVLSVLIVVIRNVTNSATIGNLTGVYSFIRNWFGSADYAINTQFLGFNLTKTYSFNLLIADLAKLSIDAFKYLALYVLVGVSQWAATIFTQKIQNPLVPSKDEKKKKKSGDSVSPEVLQGQMMKSMNLILPFSTIFIVVSAPSALSVYWIVQSLMLVVQYWILDWDKTKKGVQNLFTKYFMKQSK